MAAVLTPDKISFRHGIIDFSRKDPVLGLFHLVRPSTDGICKEAWEEGIVDLISEIAECSSLEALSEDLEAYHAESDEEEWPTEFIETRDCPESEKNGARILFYWLSTDIDEAERVMKRYFEIPPITDEEESKREFAWNEWHDAKWYETHNLGDEDGSRSSDGSGDADVDD